MRFFPTMSFRLRRNATSVQKRTMRDKVLARRLFRRFEYDLADTDLQGLHFYVQNGIVTLYGSVRHELDQELLEDVVRGIPGVRSVVTNLQTVSPAHQTELPAPERPATPSEG